jgi:ubiquinone/menaquinone biosynthesis C-methylase UbiE
MHTLRYDAGAGAYDRLTGRWSRMYVDHVLDAAGVRAGSQVLDVATGTGDAAIAAADLVGTTGRVVAVDVSAPMLREARAKAGARRIEFAVADAQRLPYSDGSFDAIVCLFGLMFVPDPVAMLVGVRRALRPGGRVVATS